MGRTQGSLIWRADATVEFSPADPRDFLPALNLLEREAELDALDAALRRCASGAGELALIEGAAGAGKTALVDAAAAFADAAGLRVLRARGAELERAFGFGVARQLLEPVARRELFVGAARPAAPVLGYEGVSAPAGDPFAVRHALYWLIATLAAERPLALLVDDVHWADAASVGALAHLANRLRGIGVALVVAGRAEEPAALDTLRAHATLVLGVPPLGERAAAAVVRSIAPGADDGLCLACHAATGGNPFLLSELARALADGARIGAPVAVSPERVTREIGARLRRLGDGAVALARAAAVLGDGVPLRRAAFMAGLEDADGAAAADALVAGGVLRAAALDAAATDVPTLEFLHPLIGSAVYAGIGPAARSREHRRAARLLAAEAESPERVAAQLLRCPPAGDPWAFEQLHAAARIASAGAAAEAIATYLRRALDEPPPPERRAGVLLELGRAESHFDAPAAIGRLREALEVEADPERRFAVALPLAGLLGQTGHAVEAADLLEAQLDAFGAQAEAALVNVTRIDPAIRRRGDVANARLRARVRAGEADPAVLGAVAAELAMAGEPAAEAADVAERALGGVVTSATTADGWSWHNAVRTLMLAERYDLARAALDAELERHRERGSLIDAGGVLTFRAELFVHVGDLANAEVDARTLLEISAAYGWALGLGMGTGVLGEVLLERGELDAAEAVLFGGAYAGPVPHLYMNLWVLRSRGLLRLAQGAHEQAAAELREAGRRALAIDHVNPALLAWRAPLAHALLELGQAAKAGELAREEVERARAFGTRRALGMALLGLARVSRELAPLREAVAVLDGSPAALETARAQLALGAALRATGDVASARAALRRAIDVAHRCGGRAVEDAALAELRATGARPRRRLTTGAGALTPSERRIAELAAAGRQNREIAEALFVTTATVEFHLRNAFRKLGIATRAQLAASL